MELASQALDLARTGAPEAEISVSVGRSAQWLTRFATSFIHQNVADETTTVSLAVHVDGASVRLPGAMWLVSSAPAR